MNYGEVKIRYNTMAQEEDPHWRVLIEEEEHLATHVILEIPSYTTKDLIPEVGEKWHISCQPKDVLWHGTICVLK